MSNTALEKLTWVLIYGGLLTGMLGVFMALQADPAGGYTGEVLGVAGAAAVIVGAFLIWVRARRRT